MTQIVDDLESLAVDIDTLVLLPGNPRRGDVEAVKRSYAAFGQRKPIVARRADRVVLAGNHQLMAARALGWAQIAVVWVDDDEITAKAFALADNHVADLGSYENDLLAEMLSAVRAGAADDIIEAMSYSSSEMARLLEEHADPLEAPDQTDQLSGSWVVIIDCESEAQQLRLLDQLEREGLSCRALTS